MANFTIERSTIERSTIKEVVETELFALADLDNSGCDVWVARNEQGEIVGFMQGNINVLQINFVESIERGAGRAMVEFFADGEEFVIADNVSKGCEGFWAALGFERIEDSNPMFPQWKRVADEL